MFLSKNDDVLTFSEAVSFITDTENISLSSLFNNIKFRESDVEEVLGTYFMRYRNKNSGDAMKHLIYGLVLKGILKAYKQIKQHYFENNKETLYIEMESQEDLIKTLSVENIAYKEKVERLTREIGTTQVEAEKTHAEKIRGLEAEVSRLRRELAAEKQKEQELVALREFVFSLDRKLVPETRDALMDLSKTTGAIIGGHQRWQQKMKELLPGWIFISSEIFDARVLDGAQALCFFTQYLSHSLYYKVITEARKRELHIGYISSVNEELALREIAATIKKART